ncbi:MAG TPA: hypothetical protein VI231_22305 [Candidatus Binatia bacterium]|jgi:hypothetical protein
MGVAQLVQLPCARCGEYAATLELRQLSGEMAGMMAGLIGILRVKAMISGAELPEQLAGDVHPLAAFPPAAIAQFLGLVHATCSAAAIAAGELTPASPELQVAGS